MMRLELSQFVESDLDDIAAFISKTNDPFGCGAFNCTQFTMDDVSVALKNPPTPSIPEPSSIALMLVGLGSLGLLKKFRAH
jgi:hypothetical protein